jgi:PAS domain S-box-containing protein
MRGFKGRCGCPWQTSTPATRRPTDQTIDATPEELQIIREQLTDIEQMLAVISGGLYSRQPASLKSRSLAADLIDRHFEGIVAQWSEAVSNLFKSINSDNHSHENDDHSPRKERSSWSSNSMIRFIAHMRDPDDLTTYVYLRKHCQEGMLARMGPGQFNVVHIALKQVLLNHAKTTLTGHKMDAVRDVIVSSIDERRLMVSQFYIESRERALRASEEKYRNAINHAPDPIYEIDFKTGAIIAANSAAERLIEHALGGSTQVGHSITDLVPADMKPETMKHFKNVLVNGADQVYDVPFYGRHFDINSALIPFGDKQFIQTILHDITEKQEIMNELLKAERLAATGTFAAGVAHEVNNPLASISSLVQSLLGDENDASRRMTLHTILSQITRISGTLKDLMNFSKPTKVESKRLDLNSLVGETLRLISYNKRFSGIAIEPALDHDLTAVYADGNEIQQVLLNLLFNAADALPSQNGVIKVVTENMSSANGERRSKVLLRVVDNGIGIPREHLEKVFDPFFTTKPAGSGVGLGLSLCQRMVLAIGGKIKIDSEVGKGSTVTVYLPAFRIEQNESVSLAQ